MSNVNGNDIDDLFKRAADGYPLRTDKSDWASVVADLERDPSLILPPMNTEQDGRRRQRFFWLFLLLPLGGLGYLTWRSGVSHTHPVARAGQEVTAASKPSVPTVTTTSSDPLQKDHSTGGDKTHPSATDRNLPGTDQHLSGPDPNLSVPDKKLSGTGQHLSGQDHDLSKQDQQASRHDQNLSGPDRDLSPRDLSPCDQNTLAHKQHTSTQDRDLSKQDQQASRRNQHFPGNDRVSPGRDQDLSGHDRNLSGNDRDSSAGIGLSSNSDERITANKTNIPGTNVYKMSPGGSTGDAATRPVTAKRAGLRGDYAVNIPVAAGSVQPLVKDKRTPAKLKKGKPSFYVGLMAAPDISSVKFQSVKGTGTTYSLLLGYNFGSRWSIETGLSLDKKNYYTSGEYFNKSKTPQLQQLDLKKLDGICNMWEIPLNVRYNLSAGPGKTKWFATAGLSSYLMTKETYAYTASYLGGGPTWDKTWVYKKPSQYWFSIFNVSIGYEQKLGNIGNLRLEPYLRIPLGGVGTGSLPIMSAGLNIGITRKIW